MGKIKNKKKFLKKAFTLLELLIIVAIISLLSGVLLVGINASRNKARVSSTKQILRSLQTAIGICCTTSYLADTAGGNVCQNPISATLPSGQRLTGDTAGTVQYTIISQCNSNNPQYRVVLSNHPVAKCNDSTVGWNVSISGVIPPPGC